MTKKLKSLGVFTLDHPGPWVTRGGQPVEIKIKDGRGIYPVIGYIADNVALFSWRENGEHISGAYDAMTDLFNAEYVKEPREFFLNMYGDDLAPYAHPTKAVADERAKFGRIECIHVREVLPGDDA